MWLLSSAQKSATFEYHILSEGTVTVNIIASLITIIYLIMYYTSYSYLINYEQTLH